MCDATFICRSGDGFPLVESWDDSIKSRYGGKSTNEIKITARIICRNLDVSNKKCSVYEGDLTYHYFVDGGICYMTVCLTSYPKKMAFVYLGELSNAFKEEIRIHFGTTGVDYQSAIETMDRPYAFIKFDRMIHKIKQNFQDPTSVKALNKINENLTQVTDIMKKNITDIINRGETLQDMGRTARGLVEESMKFERESKLLNAKGMERFIVTGLTLVLIYITLRILF
ncbi:vesicle transport protein SEC22 [Babesia microti strain RI]|uniref:Vesicle transport protein SEC22 n=1 Tax=Babesia microti (strain RI) TaxID=1133968 RepID=I7IA69_BABMR|nr:vesicle transport protein SEC22 [Babesia microti strain RI]CCF76159.2 vesicle transport protein SEC22 [Babesia microti strain RI]|eukprot:XP_012650567.2 vesicle transport protein SEC22 [Babesia microti strain RI]